LQNNGGKMEFEELNRIPYSLEAERALIGGIFFDVNSLDEIKYIIKSDDFYKKEHAEIYRAIENLFSESRGVDPILVVEEIKKSDLKNEEEILQVLTEIIDENTSSYNLLEYAELIKEKAMLRRLGQVGMEITKTAYTDVRTAEEIMDEAEAKVLNLSKNILKNSIVDMKTASVEEMKRIDNVERNRGKTLGISTGFIDLDRMTSGLNNSDLIILAARPAMGKTAFTLSMARNIAVNSKIPVAFFSLEMSSIQLITRLISSETGISSDKLRTGKLTEEDFERLTHKTQSLLEAPLYIDDTPSLSIFDLRAKARKMVSQHDVKIIFIDYLQLMTANTSGKGVGNREQEISTISRNLKALAKELDLPIIALSQLSRNVESRLGHKRPQLSDLRESGAIEQDADIVTFLYRPEYYKLDTWDDPDASSTANQAEFIVAKHRNGGLDNIRLQFINGVFSNLNTLFSGTATGQGVQSFSSKFNNQEEDTKSGAPVPKGDVNSAFSGRNDDPPEGVVGF